jgi:nitrile hydratase subunit beta
MVGMDGVHDLGGMIGFGPVDVETDEPVFHATWEARVFGLTPLVVGYAGAGTPTFRHSIERMRPEHYLSSSYYEHWLTAIATLAVEADLVDADELDARAGGFPLSRPVATNPVPGRLAAPAAAEPRYGVGNRVRVRNDHPLGHTRCPNYVRGCEGEVIRVDPGDPVPEIEAHLGRVERETTYCVRFTMVELWGDDAGTGDALCIDLYERYLEDTP